MFKLSKKSGPDSYVLPNIIREFSNNAATSTVCHTQANDRL